VCFRFPGPNRALPQRMPSPGVAFFGFFARSISESDDLGALSCPGVRQRSEAVDVDRRQLVWRRLKDVPVESGFARTRPSRWTGHEQATPVAARAVRRVGRTSIPAAAGMKTPSVARAWRCTWGMSAEPKRWRKEMPPSRGLHAREYSRPTPAGGLLRPLSAHQVRPSNPSGVVRKGLGGLLKRWSV
jgi:hypothetical protein